MSQRIGESFLSSGKLTKEQVDIVLNSQRNSHELFGERAVELGFLSESDLVLFLSKIYKIKAIDLDFMYIDKNTLFSIEYEIAERAVAVPFFKDRNVIQIAIADPGNIQLIDMLADYFYGLNVEFFVAKKNAILKFIEIIKCNVSDFDRNPLLLLNKIIFKSIEKGGSDIHFEPHENFVQIRVRIDGVLQILQSVDVEIWERMQTRLKLISNLNITENRRPQSGHTRIFLAGKNVDLRVSTHPGIYGEDFVVRIFDLSNGVKKLSELGFPKDDFLWLKNILKHPSGIFLIVGATGSGKTTTLYSLLNEINSPDINIMTLEDPVEYLIPGARQLDLREGGILSFSDGVKSILRQDPDVLLIGEIRDEKTAASALRAALTGRLVLSTLHASTPREGIRRLLDLKLSLSDFLPSLIGIFSQRLVRYKIDGEYKGRFPITEYIYFNQEIRDNLLKTNDIYMCKNEKNFQDSARYAIENCMTDEQEIKRILGDVV